MMELISTILTWVNIIGILCLLLFLIVLVLNANRPNGYRFSFSKRRQEIPEPGKTSITLQLDDDLLESLRAKSKDDGQSNQIMITEALRNSLDLKKVNSIR